ncbi:hypothetical protein KX729_01110 [Rhizobium sp. XQZ8]|uniref:hypothetical protein n=1 Tax=Rhizobium populisoli TaxID=2859785 RepID=UPI001CA47CA2|nr:hypothetical protein [Rhizobium populisoli]MBW6420037.1 hypothetical protein [Rhizobium populisoli]
MSRHLWLAAWFFAACVLGAVPASAEPAKIGEAGDYVLFLDKNKKPVAGTYWVSPDVRAVAHASMPGGSPSNLIFVDREFFPTRVAAPVYFLNYEYSYSTDPLALDVGQSRDMVENRRQVGLLADQVKPRDTPFKLTIRAKIASTINGYNLTSLVYFKETDVKDPPGQWGRRIYVQPFGIDLSSELAARVDSLTVGKADSAGDFHVIFTEMADVIPSLTQCIREKRKTEEYKAAIRSDHEKVDTVMARDFLNEDIGWWERVDMPRTIEFLMFDMCPPSK